MPNPGSSPTTSLPATLRPWHQRRWFNRVWRAVRVVLVAYLIVVLLMMWFEESLIFLPFSSPDDDWHPAGLQVEDAWFKTADGVRIHGWYVPHEHARGAVLFAHGNAGNVTHRADVLLR